MLVTAVVSFISLFYITFVNIIVGYKFPINNTLLLYIYNCKNNGRLLNSCKTNTMSHYLKLSDHRFPGEYLHPLLIYTFLSQLLHSLTKNWSIQNYSRKYLSKSALHLNQTWNTKLSIKQKHKVTNFIQGHSWLNRFHLYTYIPCIFYHPEGWKQSGVRWSLNIDCKWHSWIHVKQFGFLLIHYCL